MGISDDLRVAQDALSGARYLLPDYTLNKAKDLDAEEILNLGIQYVVFDFDSTVANWGSYSLPKTSQELFRRLLDAGIKVAIASNGHQNRFRKLSEKWKEDGVVILGRCGKPNPDKLTEFLKSRGWDPARTLMVGDNVMSDVAAAKQAGCRTALVRPWSWFEFPLTKVWRVLEDYHRMRRRKEWQGIPHMGNGDKLKYQISFPEVLSLIVLLFSIFLVTWPLTTGPVPASEVSSLELGIANSIDRGWPVPGPNEPERSLITVGLLSLLGNKSSPGQWVSVLFTLVLITASWLFYLLQRRVNSPPTSLVLTAVVWFTPAFLAATGELSPSSLELLLVLAILLSSGRAVLTGFLFFLALLNGLSAIALAPVVLLQAGSHNRRSIFIALSVAALIASAFWVLATSRPITPGPGWDKTSIDHGSIAFASMATTSDVELSKTIFSVEKDLEYGILGKTNISAKLPLVLLVGVFSFILLIPDFPGIASFVLLRSIGLLCFPSLFFRPMLLIVFLPFLVLSMSSSLRRAWRGHLSLLLALVLGCLVVTNVPSIRRQVFVARRSYRANPDLILLAKAAADNLPDSSIVSSPSPALFNLYSGLRTLPPAKTTILPEIVTHNVIPRDQTTDPACILQNDLMLCPIR